jgi:hypothetical protein
MDGKFVMICSMTCMIYDLGYLSISLRYLLHIFESDLEFEYGN